ncbi:MAG: caspase family protein [Terracidiphilus sp.]
MKAVVAVTSALIGVLAGSLAVAQTQRALLIGIDTYQPEGTTAEHPAGCVYGRCELGSFQNLDGSVNDARAMADLLTSPKFGFPASNVVLLTNPAAPRPRRGIAVLPASETTHDGILAAMQKYLIDVPKKGDTVVFYDASHGSLRVNSKGNKLTVLVNGQYVHADSTLVPSDAYKGGYDVRDREMTRIFNAALDKGVHLTVIFDSCHSGGISRGIGPVYRERALAFDPRDIDEAPDALPNGQPRPAPTERAENPALVFSAAQQDQTAKEMPPAAGAASEPHGAFTAALLEALEALPADTPASVVYERVKAVLEGSNVPDQEPDLDASAARREQPLFGGAAEKSARILAASLGTGDDGTVALDIGRASGVGVGSEFTASVPDSAGQKVQLRIARLDGLARSAAEVVGPAGAKADPGEIFELTKWIPADNPPLRVWLWPSNLSEDEILVAAAQVRAAGAALVADPAEEQWTHVLSWDGARWTLQQAGSATPVSLGDRLTADAIRQHLPAGAKLWVNLPPSRELAAKIKPDSESAVQPADNLAAAQYALTGILTAGGPAYAWYHKSELAAGPPAPDAPPHSPGCSATSPYPVRTDWVPLAGAADLEAASTKLSNYSSLLAKVHGWLELANSPADASTGEYYSLSLIPSSGSAPLTPDQTAHQGEQWKMALASEERVIDRRWVYVLDIDCHGRGTVLYPRGNAENQFPNDADNGRQFVLPGAPVLRIGPPYGVDTLILLSTEQPLADPFALNFEGVASRGARGAASPLERLLNQTSGGTRGFSGEVPTNWGIGLMTVHSAPKTGSN